MHESIKKLTRKSSAVIQPILNVNLTNHGILIREFFIKQRLWKQSQNLSKLTDQDKKFRNDGWFSMDKTLRF